jgi:hypothetical protein
MTMRNIFIGFCFLVTFTFGANAQNIKVSVELSSDTVLIGNYLRVKFTLENSSASFEAPAFKGFRVISGPNVSSSMNFINGKLSQKISYEYYLDPEDVGQYFIEEAYFVSDIETFATEPLEIYVLLNPDGIKQDSEIKFLDEYLFEKEPEEDPKKKIKAKRHKI